MKKKQILAKFFGLIGRKDADDAAEKGVTTTADLEAAIAKMEAKQKKADEGDPAEGDAPVLTFDVTSGETCYIKTANTEISEGDEVFTDEELTTALADGSYQVDGGDLDGDTFKVAGGKVTSVISDIGEPAGAATDKSKKKAEAPAAPAASAKTGLDALVDRITALEAGFDAERQAHDVTKGKLNKALGIAEGNKKKAKESTEYVEVSVTDEAPAVVVSESDQELAKARKAAGWKPKAK